MTHALINTIAVAIENLKTYTRDNKKSYTSDAALNISLNTYTKIFSNINRIKTDMLYIYNIYLIYLTIDK